MDTAFIYDNILVTRYLLTNRWCNTNDTQFFLISYGLQSGQFKNILLYICGNLVWSCTYLVISCRPSIRSGIVFKKASSPWSKLKMGVSPRLNGNSPMSFLGGGGGGGFLV